MVQINFFIDSNILVINDIYENYNLQGINQQNIKIIELYNKFYKEFLKTISDYNKMKTELSGTFGFLSQIHFYISSLSFIELALITQRKLFKNVDQWSDIKKKQMLNNFSKFIVDIYNIFHNDIIDLDEDVIRNAYEPNKHRPCLKNVDFIESDHYEFEDALIFAQFRKIVKPGDINIIISNNKRDFEFLKVKPFQNYENLNQNTSDQDRIDICMKIRKAIRVNDNFLVLSFEEFAGSDFYKNIKQLLKSRSDFSDKEKVNNLRIQTALVYKNFPTILDKWTQSPDLRHEPSQCLDSTIHKFHQQLMTRIENYNFSPHKAVSSGDKLVFLDSSLLNFTGATDFWNRNVDIKDLNLGKDVLSIIKEPKFVCFASPFSHYKAVAKISDTISLQARQEMDIMHKIIASMIHGKRMKSEILDFMGKTVLHNKKLEVLVETLIDDLKTRQIISENPSHSYELNKKWACRTMILFQISEKNPIQINELYSNQPKHFPDYSEKEINDGINFLITHHYCSYYDTQKTQLVREDKYVDRFEYVPDLVPDSIKFPPSAKLDSLGFDDKIKFMDKSKEVVLDWNLNLYPGSMVDAINSIMQGHNLMKNLRISFSSSQRIPPFYILETNFMFLLELYMCKKLAEQYPSNNVYFLTYNPRITDSVFTVPNLITLTPEMFLNKMKGLGIIGLGAIAEEEEDPRMRLRRIIIEVLLDHGGSMRQDLLFEAVKEYF